MSPPLRAFAHLALAALFLVLSVAGAMLACSPSTTANKEKLDCDWVTSPDPNVNCWRPFVASIDRCLGNLDGGIRADADAQGVLADDRLSCRYPDGGRVVTATLPLDRPREEEPDATDSRARSFVVRLASGELCLQFVQSGATATATGPDGALSWTSDETGVTVRCPDGHVARGAPTDLFDCLVPGQLPSYAYINTDASAFFSLAGMVGPAYACYVPQLTPYDAIASVDGP